VDRSVIILFVQTILLATSNEGKIMEIRECLSKLDLAVYTLNDLIDIPQQPEETGGTYEENALLKARYYFRHSGIPTVADDSGIQVEALQGELGIHTRRWGAGSAASDQEWIDFFLARMRTEKNKRAHFVSVLAFVDGDHEKICEGHCDGVITDELEADYLPGLPISACFIPDSCKQVFSALSINEKNRVSHRGRAVQTLCDYFSGL
jgi:XTP/dITP diphosphohydrolase